MNYAELLDEQINELVATKVMKWHKQEDGICWITFDDRYTGKLYDKVQDDELGNLEVDYWDPTNDLNQCYMAEEEIINNFDRTENMPGAICDWYAVKLRRMLEPMCLSPIGSVLSMNKLERLVIHATARQKCIAMLMAVENE